MSQPSPENPGMRFVETARGAQFIYDFGGPAGASWLHFAHANGFNGLTYRHILAPLTESFRVIAWDARGHGQSTLAADPARQTNWSTYGKDLAALVETLEGPVYLSGHSLGGATSIDTAGRMAGRVAGLVLADPVMPPTAVSVGINVARIFGVPAVNPMARAALGRRRDFPDAATAIKSFTGRGAFKTWAPEMVADYVTGGVKPSDTGVTLACAPEWEAVNFSTMPDNLTSAFGKIKSPVILLAAAKNSTAPAAMTLGAKVFCPQMEVHRIDGTTHFLPMERPDLIRRAVYAIAGGAPFQIEEA